MERPDEPGGYRCAADEMRRMVSVTKVDEDVLLLKRVILIWDRLICEIKALVCTGMRPMDKKKKKCKLLPELHFFIYFLMFWCVFWSYLCCIFCHVFPSSPWHPGRQRLQACFQNNTSPDNHIPAITARSYRPICPADTKAKLTFKKINKISGIKMAQKWLQTLTHAHTNESRRYSYSNDKSYLSNCGSFLLLGFNAWRRDWKVGEWREEEEEEWRVLVSPRHPHTPSLTTYQPKIWQTDRQSDGQTNFLYRPASHAQNACQNSI